MPLIESKSAGNSGKTGIWHITETLDELTEQRTIQQTEYDLFDAIGADHKKSEWLTARILSAHLLGIDKVQIRHDEWSKPHFMFVKKHLSVTHSHGLLAVMIDDEPTGTDLELIKPTVVRIKDKFMSEEEMADVNKNDELEKLTLYWCVKESLYKVYGKKELRFKEHLKASPFTLSDRGEINAMIEHPLFKKEFVLEYEKINVRSNSFFWTRVIRK